MPPPELKGIAELSHPFAEFQPHYEWLGFEARLLLFNLLEACLVGKELTVEAMIYECREPAVLGWFETLGGRLRALVDDHGESGDDANHERESARRLEAAGATPNEKPWFAAYFQIGHVKERDRQLFIA